MTEQTITSYVTMYGFPDNDPPDTAYIANPVLHQLAGGTGTFNDPITFASDPRVILSALRFTCRISKNTSSWRTSALKLFSTPVSFTLICGRAELPRQM